MGLVFIERYIKMEHIEIKTKTNKEAIKVLESEE